MELTGFSCVLHSLRGHKVIRWPIPCLWLALKSQWCVEHLTPQNTQKIVVGATGAHLLVQKKSKFIFLEGKFFFEELMSNAFLWSSVSSVLFHYLSSGNQFNRKGETRKCYAVPRKWGFITERTKFFPKLVFETNTRKDLMALLSFLQRGSVILKDNSIQKLLNLSEIDKN